MTQRDKLASGACVPTPQICLIVGRDAEYLESYRSLRVFPRIFPLSICCKQIFGPCRPFPCGRYQSTLIVLACSDLDLSGIFARSSRKLGQRHLALNLDRCHLYSGAVARSLAMCIFSILRHTRTSSSRSRTSRNSFNRRPVTRSRPRA